MRSTSRFACLTLAGLLASIVCLPSAAQWIDRGLHDHTLVEIERSDAHLYAATHSGIFRQPLDRPEDPWTAAGFDGQPILAIAVTGADTILAAVDTRDGGAPVASLHRSTDGGENWVSIGEHLSDEAPDLRVESMAVHPQRSQTVFLGGAQVIVRSDDLGETWRPVWGDFGDIGMGVHFFAFDPNDTDVIRSGGETAAFGPFTLLSTDGGDSWAMHTLSLGGDNAVYSTVIHSADSDVVLAGTEGSVLRSTDGGDRWEVVLEPEEYPYFHGLVESEVLDTRMYAAGWRRVDTQDLIVYITSDAGTSWAERPLGASGR
ncbi:MAG: hypothetical protein ACOCTG_06940, partial [Bacteroidota bacterium]